MIKANDWPVAVCSWSLGNDFQKLNELAEQTSISHIHLDLGPTLTNDGKTYLENIQYHNWTVTAAMIGFPQEDYSSLQAIKQTGGIIPDEQWEENKKRVADALYVTAELGLKFLTFHFGFLETTDPAQKKKIYDRANVLADEAQRKEVQLLMETGQETADELREFLEGLSRPELAVNFDPANVILYDKGQPIEALNTLAPWIKHVHIKDANRTKSPGTWGDEVPWGDGQVNQDRFLNALKKINYQGALAVEREAGDDRFADIKTAVQRLQQLKQ